LTTVNDGFLLWTIPPPFGSTPADSGQQRSGTGPPVRRRCPAEALTLAGTGQSGFGALSSSFGSNSWAGNITLSSNANISVLAGDFLNLSGCDQR